MNPENSASDEKSVARLYNDLKVAEQYIRRRFNLSWSRLLHHRQVAEINRVIRNCQPERIVEIAPGPARIATDLQGVRTGLMIDSSEHMLTLARRRINAVGLDSVWELRQHNAFDLDTLESECDLLYAFRFIRHFKPDERSRLYRAIRASLKPKGLFMLDVVNRLVRRKLDAKHPLESNEALDVYDATYSPEEFHQEMRAHGFAVISLKPVVRHFVLQSWMSYTFDHRIPRFSKRIVHLFEQLPSQNPLEWIALSCKID